MKYEVGQRPLFKVSTIRTHRSYDSQYKRYKIHDIIDFIVGEAYIVYINGVKQYFNDSHTL